MHYFLGLNDPGTGRAIKQHKKEIHMKDRDDFIAIDFRPSLTAMNRPYRTIQDKSEEI